MNRRRVLTYLIFFFTIFAIGISLILALTISEFDGDTQGSTRWGNTSSNWEKIAFEHTPTSTYDINSFSIELIRESESTGTLALTIYEGGTEPEDGSIVATSSINTEDIGTAGGCANDVYNAYSFPQFQYSASTTYFFTLVPNAASSSDGLFTCGNNNNFAWVYNILAYGGWNDNGATLSHKIDTASNSVELTFPVDNSTTTENFGLWQGTYHFDDVYILPSVIIRYGVSSTTWDFSDAEPLTLTGGNFGVNRTNDLASSTLYYAQAELVHGVLQTILATSSIIEFTIPNASGELVFPSIEDYQEILEISTSTSILRSRFPFSYWYDLRDLYAITTHAPTSALPTLSIDIQSSSIPITFVIFSSSTVRTYISESTIYTLRGLLMAFLWLSFGFYIFNRIRHLDL